MLRGRCRPLAPVGVIEAPRVQLTHGLFRTIEKPTSLPTAALKYPSRRNPDSFIQGGSAEGRWRTNTTIARWRHYHRSPPSRIGLGTLIHLAREAGWRPTGGRAAS